ncbi:uncharacterized [Tachysurus ichikawai]
MLGDEVNTQYADTHAYIYPSCQKVTQTQDTEALLSMCFLRIKEDWAQPPVPTELITVGKACTGSVQQEPELGPLLHQADARYSSILTCTL